MQDGAQVQAHTACCSLTAAMSALLLVTATRALDDAAVSGHGKSTGKNLSRQHPQHLASIRHTS